MGLIFFVSTTEVEEREGVMSSKIVVQTDYYEGQVGEERHGDGKQIVPDSSKDYVY